MCTALVCQHSSFHFACCACRRPWQLELGLAKCTRRFELFPLLMAIHNGHVDVSMRSVCRRCGRLGPATIAHDRPEQPRRVVLNNFCFQNFFMSLFDGGVCTLMLTMDVSVH